MRTPDPDQPPLYAEPEPHVLEQSETVPVTPAPTRELAETGVEVSLLPAVLLVATGIALLHRGRAR